MFSKILIANRGEIAVRIIRACKEMGITTVAVCSVGDREALHCMLADQVVCIGPDPAVSSYLNQDAIVSAAAATGAQAVHPGYGLLSENAKFAGLCIQNGLRFIGPKPEVISKVGDKDAAKRVMAAAGVPVIPGGELLKDAEDAIRQAGRIGYPVLLKARAGGGGKGIRLIRDKSQMDSAFTIASEEARRSFGDGGLFLEKYMEKVKHVEMQILSDGQGTVVCMGERNCSIQRNNQKLIEEAPAPELSPKLRRAMSMAAIAAVNAVDYQNAGTVEFLLDDRTGKFYFMEMNTRLQVEHPVTEAVTGIDLVKWQIRIAAGIPLKFRQDDVELRGASIECRVNAKTGGRITQLHIPGGPGVRFDTALCIGSLVPPYYDPMIGKLVVHAINRAEAVRKLRSALCELVIEGVETNIDDQLKIIGSEDFKSGNYYTDFLSGR